MTIYATYHTNGPPWNLGTTPGAGIRRYSNGVWVDVAAGLAEFIESYSNIVGTRWQINDMWFVANSLWVAWEDTANFTTGISALAGSTWRHLAYASLDGRVFASLDGRVFSGGFSEPRVLVFNGFFCWQGRPYIHATDFTNRRFLVFSIAGNEISLYAEDSTRKMSLNQAFRGCALISSTHPNLLIIGDANEDNFCYFNMVTKTFTQGSYPGGSCIFAMGIDNNNLIWTGDYFNEFYVSRDGGLTFERTGQPNDSSLPDIGLPELWEMKHWKGNLYGVGCNPIGIIRRNANTNAIDPHFTTVATYPEIDKMIDGVGFISFQPVGNEAYVGCGSEPWYYQRQSNQATGQVFRVDANYGLHDIGAGLHWGTGVHQICDESRSCAGGILSGDPGEHGVRYDNTTEISPRMLSHQ